MRDRGGDIRRAPPAARRGRRRLLVDVGRHRHVRLGGHAVHGPGVDLHEAGGRGGDDGGVGVCLERGLDLVIAILAILKSGGAYVPLDPAYPVDRIEGMMRDSGIQVLVTERGRSGSSHSIDRWLDAVGGCGS